MPFLSRRQNSGRAATRRCRQSSHRRLDRPLKVEVLEDRLLLTHPAEPFTLLWTGDLVTREVLAGDGPWTVDVEVLQGRISPNSHIIVRESLPGDNCIVEHVGGTQTLNFDLPASKPNGCGSGYPGGDPGKYPDTNGYPYVLLVALVGGKRSSATVTVTHPGSHHGNELYIDNVRLKEGNKGTTDFVFRVARPTGVGTVSVDFETLDGTAIADEDYTPISGTLTFLPGETVKEIVVKVKGDRKNEPGDFETFKVELSNPQDLSNPTEVWTFDKAIGDGTILDDDRK